MPFWAISPAALTAVCTRSPRLGGSTGRADSGARGGGGSAARIRALARGASGLAFDDPDAAAGLVRAFARAVDRDFAGDFAFPGAAFAVLARLGLAAAFGFAAEAFGLAF